MEQLKFMQKKLQQMVLPRKLKNHYAAYAVDIFLLLLFAAYAYVRGPGNILMHYTVLAILLIGPISSIIRSRSEYLLLSTGTPVIAEVEDVLNTNKGPESRNPSSMVTYKWKGAEMTTELYFKKKTPEEQLERYVLILVDPNKPENIMLYDRVGYFELDLSSIIGS